MNSPRNALLLWTTIGLAGLAVLIAQAHGVAWSSASPYESALFAVQNITFSTSGTELVFDAHPSERLLQYAVAISSALVGTLAMILWAASLAMAIFGARKSTSGK